ncbi:MAG: CHAD domain-containing protein [Acidobacteriia bacterium]|nr:CHAD domain-containing protein [Terriglobia bacterium]
MTAKRPIRKDSGLVHWMNQVPKEADKAADGFDSEAVHDLRVALRRCRSMADGFRAIDPHKDWKRMRRQATALFDNLGALRDCHVITEWTQKLGQADDPITRQLLDHLRRQEASLQEQAKSAIDVFDRKQWQSWTRQLGQRARRLPLGSHVFQVLALEKLIAARRLEAAALKSGNDIAFHKLRIGLKKFRYVVENFLPQLHHEWKAGLKHIQDLLGEIHDLDVVRETVLSVCASAAPAALQRWEEAVAAERLQRANLYSEVMVGESSLWRVWRSALPQGKAAREASLKRLQAWSSFMDSDLQHNRRVTRFAIQIHDSLAHLGLLKGADKNSRELLKAAAMVHEVGRFAGEKNHHKSTQQMVSSLDRIVGWTRLEVMTMASVARYHRGALPQAARLRDIPTAQRKIIMLLAGILRLANALDDERDGQIKRIKVSHHANYILIQAQGLRQDNMLAEKIAAGRHLLEMICGLPVLVCPMPNRAAARRSRP